MQISTAVVFVAADAFFVDAMHIPPPMTTRATIALVGLNIFDFFFSIILV
jgi:hypothetical protein